MITHLSHVTIFVHDQAAALEWYQKIGFQIHTDAAFTNPDTGIHTRWLTLCLPGNPHLELALITAVTPEQKALVGKQAHGCPLISLATDSCRDDVAALKRAGASVIQEPTEEPWGVSATLHDLYGNMIYLCEERK